MGIPRVPTYYDPHAGASTVPLRPTPLLPAYDNREGRRKDKRPLTEDELTELHQREKRLRLGAPTEKVLVLKPLFEAEKARIEVAAEQATLDLLSTEEIEHNNQLEAERDAAALANLLSPKEIEENNMLEARRKQEAEDAAMAAQMQEDKRQLLEVGENVQLPEPQAEDEDRLKEIRESLRRTLQTAKALDRKIRAAIEEDRGYQLALSRQRQDSMNFISKVSIHGTKSGRAEGAIQVKITRRDDTVFVYLDDELFSRLSVVEWGTVINLARGSGSRYKAQFIASLDSMIEGAEAFQKRRAEGNPRIAELREQQRRLRINREALKAELFISCLRNK